MKTIKLAVLLVAVLSAPIALSAFVWLALVCIWRSNGRGGTL